MNLAARLTVPVAVAVLAGCGLATMGQRPPENLDMWSPTPLAPDAILEAMAMTGDSACRMGDPLANVAAPAPQVLVQDRRTENAAAFLVVSEGKVGDCLFTRGGGSAGSFGHVLGAMNGPLTIEIRSSGTVGNGPVDVLGGRIAVPGVQVIVELHDGRKIHASSGNGYWLIWRPAFNGAKRVFAESPDGTEVASIEVPAE